METIDVQKKIRAKKPGFCQKPGFSSPNDYLNFYSSLCRPRSGGSHDDNYRPQIWGDPKPAMLTAELSEFAQAITERRQPSMTVGAGRRVLRVLDAVIKADRSRGARWLH